MKLERYYISFENDPNIFFDQAVFVEYRSVISGERAHLPYLLWNGRLHAFPIQIAQWGLNIANRYYNGENELAKEIPVIADYFVENLITDEKGRHFWDMKIHRPDYELKPPWKSAMAQGEGISFLLRAFEITGNDSYRSAAEKAFEIMTVPVEDCGVLGEFSDNSPALQEYPSKPQSHVLNGMIFAILGLYDLSRYSDEYVDLFNAHCEGLIGNLAHYDNGIWSKYDLYRGGKSASVIYHWLHIAQLEVLREIYPEGAKVLSRYIKKWRRYFNSSTQRLFRITARVLEKLSRGR